MPIFGAKSRAKRGCASKLACGHRIGPLGSCEFAEDFHKNGAICGRTESSAPTGSAKSFCRGRRLCRPNKCYEFAENFQKNGALCGPMWASAPTNKCESAWGSAENQCKSCNTLLPNLSNSVSPTGAFALVDFPGIARYNKEKQKRGP